jgi:hypothetical protein
MNSARLFVESVGKFGTRTQPFLTGSGRVSGWYKSPSATRGAVCVYYCSTFYKAVRDQGEEDVFNGTPCGTFAQFGTEEDGVAVSEKFVKERKKRKAICTTNFIIAV